MLPQKLAFVDLETTGASVNRDRIIEIGIVLVENNRLVETFTSLVNPETSLPPEISRFTGISAAELDSAPTFNSLKKDILSLLDGYVFVAHNAAFDYSFLRSEFRRCDLTFRSRVLCTVKLSRRMYPAFRKHSLDALIDRHQLPVTHRHRALPDALTTWEYYRLLAGERPEDLDSHITHLLKETNLPLRLSREDIANLPEGPGVYIFYNEAGAPLYVGKSIHLRERILSHFDNFRFTQDLASIETIPAAGELGACLLESRMIKKLQPLYNRQLRQYSQLYILTSHPDSAGYQAVTASPAATIGPGDLAGIIGIFKSRTQARDHLAQLAGEFQLCDKLLGLHKYSGPCFGAGLGRCLGACVGREDPLAYNLRFTKAFSRTRISSWPFSSRIVISETDAGTGLTAGYIVDHWCHLGTLNGSAQTEEEELSGPEFDLDTYRILRRHLNKSGVRVKQI